jgi:hypothetical protein
MAQDPRLTLVDSIKQGHRTPGRLADIERRITRLENNYPTVQQLEGSPTTSPRDGSMAASPAGPRLWVHVGGAWHYVGLT